MTGNSLTPQNMNIENFKLVVGKIKSCPAQWDQRTWHCETSHCFAGHAQLLAGKPANDNTVRRDARIFLGLGLTDANFYFASCRTLQDFERALTADANGYDRNGYNQNGYNQNGYNQNGYNQNGYNQNGYNQNGYNRAGYDRDGLDRDNNPKPRRSLRLRAFAANKARIRRT